MRTAGVGLGLLIFSAAMSAWAQSALPTRTEALMANLSENYEQAHFDRCRTAADLKLNEVCSVGTECNPDVRIADFVEIYNPTRQKAELSCYVIANDEDIPFVPDGTIEAKGLAAWGEEQLGFRLAKHHDQVRLYRMRSVDGEAALKVLDEVEISEARALAYRSPDGGGWLAVSVADAERDQPATFKQSNP